MIIVERQTVLNKRRHWYIVYVTWYYITLHSAYVWALFYVCFMVLHYIQVLCGILMSPVLMRKYYMYM